MKNIKTSAKSKSVFLFTEEEVVVMSGQILRESIYTHLAIHSLNLSLRVNKIFLLVSCRPLRLIYVQYCGQELDNTAVFYLETQSLRFSIYGQYAFRFYDMNWSNTSLPLI